jgi:hypothetical protein
MPLFIGTTSLSRVYMLRLVGKAALFRPAVRADPLGYFPAVLARQELGRLTTNTKAVAGTAPGDRRPTKQERPRSHTVRRCEA